MIAGIVAGAANVVAPSGLESIFVNRLLNVLFYQGESHPGSEPGLSNSEWVITVEDAIQIPSETPYPGIFGKFAYNLGPFTLQAGGGGTQMLNGFWMHCLVSDGETGTPQIIFGNMEVIPADQQLDPATRDEFNAWWDSESPRLIELLDSSDNVIAQLTTSGSTTDPDNPSDPNTFRGGYAMEVPWTQSTKDAVTKIRLVIATP